MHIHQIHTTIALSIVGILFNAHTFAQVPDVEPSIAISGNVTLATDYRFRGISQTSNDPSIQGGININHKSGFYLSLWAANVNLLPGNSTEADYFLGYQWKINEKSTLDFQYIDVNYPGAIKEFHPDFSEFSVIYSRNNNYKPKDNITLSAYFSPEFAMKSGKEFYLNSSVSYPLMDNLNAIASIGYTHLESTEKFQQAYGYGTRNDYLDYKIGVKANLLGIDTELSWIDTNIQQGPKSINGSLYFALSKNF